MVKKKPAKKPVKPVKAEKKERCPHCGYCPECGRSNPHYWGGWWYQQPWTTWNTNTAASPVTIY